MNGLINLIWDYVKLGAITHRKRKECTESMHRISEFYSAELAILIILNSLFDLLVSIHYEWSISATVSFKGIPAISKSSSGDFELFAEPTEIFIPSLLKVII
jgi:hypothetical protein